MVKEEQTNQVNAIEVRDLCKVYKLYNKPSDRLKDALSLTKKQNYTTKM